jgi:hypothetical protein
MTAPHEFTFPARLDANNRIDIRGKGAGALLPN